MSSSSQKSRWTSSKPEVTSYDLLMLPHPDAVNREDKSYVIQGPGNLRTRITNENWATLRFNTKTMSPDYFPSSYLSPVPTASTEDEDMSKATFPRSTITGTLALEGFRILLLVSPLSKSSKIPQDVYRALSLNTSLNIASEALKPADKATAPKRISTFMRLCELYIPCEFDDYSDAIVRLDSEVDPDVRGAIFKHKIIK